MKKVNNNPRVFEELIAKRDEKARERTLVGEKISELNRQDQVISSIPSLSKYLKEEFEMEKKPWELARILKEDLGMQYRRIKPLSTNTNSERNLVLRQRFAMELIKLMQEGKRILNVDQTWLGMSDFRTMKWRAHGTTNSIPKTQMQPRITMFIGLDTLGQTYLSLIQSNSNQKVMEIFLRQLVLKLDKEDPKWRENTVVLHDNAPYAACEGTLELMEGLKIPMIFTGPHSYDAAPVELFFAAFKADDVNPSKLP